MPKHLLCRLGLRDALRSETSVSRVVVVDIICWEEVESQLGGHVVVCVGEPFSSRFESAKLHPSVRVALSYRESRLRLGEFVPLLQEISKRCSWEAIATKRLSDRETGIHPTNDIKSQSTPLPMEFGVLFEELLNSLNAYDRMCHEFKRVFRHLLKTSYLVIFVQNGEEFVSDVADLYIAVDDPLIKFLNRYPVAVGWDGWVGPSDPLAEISARNCLAMWNARLIIPVHANASLHGLLVCGVRDDGRYFSPEDMLCASELGRLFRDCLLTCKKLEAGERSENRLRLLTKYNPNFVFLLDHEAVPRSLPIAVRALIGQCRREQSCRTVYATEEQAFRISSVYIPEVCGVYAHWEDFSRELHDRADAVKLDRINRLRDIALTLNHEIGNSLTSLLSFTQALGTSDNLSSMRSVIIVDVERLRRLNDELNHLATIADVTPELVDIRELVEKCARMHSILVEVCEEAIQLMVVRQLLGFAIEAIVAGILANRPVASPADGILIGVRGVGVGSQRVALISIRGKGIELEGILPGKGGESIPSNGRIGVFIGKEVIRLHNGFIHAGPGLEYTEILISVRQW